MISVTFDWADDTYTFKLGLKQLRELQEACDAGPEVIRDRIAEAKPNALDLHEVMRLGLIGGGMPAANALKLVRKYVDEVPRAENYLPAFTILNASIVGPPDDPVGKSQAGETAANPPASETESGPSQPSTD